LNTYNEPIYSGTIPPEPPILPHLIPRSGVSVACSGRFEDMMTNRVKEMRKIYGEEDKMKLVEDKSFWGKWWNG
jgi:hypothetical protein